MEIYLRRIDNQFINKQVSYPEYVHKEFLDGKGEKETILCEGKKSRDQEKVALLLSTDPRFDNGILRILSKEGTPEIGDLMIMYKMKKKYLVELIKRNDSRYKAYEDLFTEGDRHVLANISDDLTRDGENYKKFKKLLGWFVKQLDINNGLEMGNKVYGQGYKDNAAIREYYKAWRNYEDFNLDCTLGRGYQTAISESNYINKTKTGINIRPRFDNIIKKVDSLSIDLYGFERDGILDEISDEILEILTKIYSIDELELFDNNEPNDLVKNLFDDYRKIIDTISKPGSESFPLAVPRIRTRYELNRILYGAPGTGKTYSTAKYAVAVIEDMPIVSYDSVSRKDIMQRYNDGISHGQIVFTTFHQNYGYEEFIQGLRPNINAGNVSFQMKDGIFKKMVKDAMNNQDKDYVLIIDEINRANISKVFGELITLIEPDKRWGEENAFTVTLPSGEIFAVPNNLYIIGTMNSADKSIALVDTALRRRFRFVEMPPRADIITNQTLQRIFVRLNKKLRDDLESSDLLIGHAYFIRKTEADIVEIFNDSVIPLLYEYYYGDETEIYDAVSDALKGTNYKTIQYSNGDEIRRIRVGK